MNEYAAQRLPTCKREHGRLVSSVQMSESVALVGSADRADECPL